MHMKATIQKMMTRKMRTATMMRKMRTALSSRGTISVLLLS